MIKTLEITGRTEDAAIEAALKELKLDRDDVSVEILERAKSGFLGIGAVPAKIRVSYEAPDEPKAPAKKAEKPANKKSEKAKEIKAEAPKKEKQPAPENESEEFKAIRAFLDGLFERMGISADINITNGEKGSVTVNLSGDNMGAVIGRRGETLDAIQHLTNYVINKGNDKRTRISIDAESYRSKREDSLETLAKKMAEKAIKYNRPMASEPMNSYERHVIHSALQNFEGVTTASTGDEPNRRVVVTPDKTVTAAASAKPKTREWA